MRSRSLLAFGSTLLALVALPSTAGAQSVNRDLTGALEVRLLALALPITVGVLSILVYATLRFRGTDDPSPAPQTPALEIGWFLATILVLLFVGVAGYTALASSYVSPAQPAQLATDDPIDDRADLPETNDSEVLVRASTWRWEATYPGANVTTRDAVVVPADENVTVWLTAADVVHAFAVADLGIKQDAIPGRYTRARTVVYDPGEYTVRCTEYCGTGHATMTASLVVVTPERYDAWLEANAGERDAAAPTPR